MLNRSEQANDEDVAVTEARTIGIGSTLLHMPSPLNQQDIHDGCLWHRHGVTTVFFKKIAFFGLDLRKAAYAHLHRHQRNFDLHQA